jgi:SAM-dependent methyltransferase
MNPSTQKAMSVQPRCGSTEVSTRQPRPDSGETAGLDRGAGHVMPCRHGIGFWDKVANGRELTKGGDAYRRIVELSGERIPPKGRVLDFGCGTGALTLELAGKAGQVLAVDTSPGMIEVASRAGMARSATNTCFQCLDLFDASLRPGRFDVALAFNVLHYVDDLHTYLARLHEVTRAGGQLLASTACMAGKWSVTVSLVRLLGVTGIMPPTRFYTERDLLAAFEAAGFAIEHTETINATTNDLYIAGRRK